MTSSSTDLLISLEPRGQIDPGYFVAALLRCCFGVVQVGLIASPRNGKPRGFNPRGKAGTSFKQSCSRDGWEPQVDLIRWRSGGLVF